MINIVLELREKWIFLFVSQQSKQMGRNWGLNKYSLPTFFFPSILFIFKRKICLKTEFIKKHIKVFCVEKDKKEKTFFLCEHSFLSQSVCWNQLTNDAKCNYLVIFGAFSLLSSLPFPEALLGQLLPSCCLQRSPSPPWPELLGILGQLVKHLLQAEQIRQQPLPSSFVLQWAPSASTAPSGLILP